MLSIAYGQGRRRNILNCLNRLEDEIRSRISQYDRIFIKPNMVSVYNQLSATNVESLDAVVGFLRRLKPEAEILIGEIPAIGDFKEGCVNYRYNDVIKKYDMRAVNLNDWPELKVRIFDRTLSTFRIPIACLSDLFTVSVSPPKTHDTVLVTLSLKNIAMGVVKKGLKVKVHQGYKAINLNIYRISRFARANLSVIDGYTGMQGNGPVNGDPVKWNMAVAGIDPVLVDAVTTWLMGLNPWKVGYISYALSYEHRDIKLEDIVRLAGKTGIRRFFELHSTYKEQMMWELSEDELNRVQSILLCEKP